ncbi:MAG: hypothetical protein RLP15_04395 [Cryomorphaceae bacterium]
MIIQQNIQVTDRKSLQMVTAYARERRNEHRASLGRTTEAFRSKWSLERITRAWGVTAIQSLIGDGLNALMDKVESNDPTEEVPVWRSLLSEFLQRFLPRFIERMA